MKALLFSVGAAILVLLAGLPIAYLNWPAPAPLAAAINDGAQIGGTFELQDLKGRSVTQETFNGRWTLVFFGFTHCPDICPTTLSHIASVMDGLGDQAAQLQPLFITLDPQRDTPELLAEYTAFFDPRILALSGSAEQTRQVAEAYGVYFKQVAAGDTYTLDHSTGLYLMGPDGEFKRRFAEPLSAGAMVKDIAGLLDAD